MISKTVPGSNSSKQLKLTCALLCLLDVDASILKKKHHTSRCNIIGSKTLLAERGKLGSCSACPIVIF